MNTRNARWSPTCARWLLASGLWCCFCRSWRLRGWCPNLAQIRPPFTRWEVRCMLSVMCIATGTFFKIAQSQEHVPPPQSMESPCWQRCPGSINWQNPVSGCPPLLTRTGRCSPAGCPPKLQACPHPVALAGRLAGDLEQHTRCYCWGCRPAAAACATQRCPPMWLTKAAGGARPGMSLSHCLEMLRAHATVAAHRPGKT